MITSALIEPAADELLGAALLGDGWADALQLLADATEAGGATLLRLRNGVPLAVLTSSDWIAAWGAQENIGVPQSPRRFFPDHVFGNGFLSDTSLWSQEELRHDPFYQEFLRPHGVFFHAKARLSVHADERVSLSLKRRKEFGPYEPADIAALNRALPKLEMATRIARRVLNAEAAGLVQALHHRGDPVFELDSWGRVLQVHGDEDEDLGIVVRNRRLSVIDRLLQGELDRTVLTAVAALRPAIVTLTNSTGDRRFVHVMPVTGRARDLFLATAVVVVVLRPDRPHREEFRRLLRLALKLTEREAQIAMLLSEGISLVTISDRLRLGLGTVRNHLKSIFEKTGTRRQGELIALLRSLPR